MRLVLALLMLVALAGPADARKVNIVFKGDSITFGDNASSGHGTTSGPVYPGVVMAALSGSTFTSSNKGIDGERCNTMAANAASEMLPAIDGTANINIAVVLCGTNDIGCNNDGTNSGCSTAAQVYARIGGYAATLKSYGYYVVVMTVLPSVYPGMPTPPTFDTIRNTLNSSLRSGYGFAIALADPANNATIGCDGCENNATYYSGSDHTHPTDAGYAILALPAITAIQTAINPPAIAAGAH